MTVRDREVLEMLRDEPELLAIADAVAETQAARSSRRVQLALATGAALAAVLFVALVPWRGGGGFSQHALAAIGDGPVLHAVISFSQPGGTLVDLASGQERQQKDVFEREIWYDGGRSLEHMITRKNGVVSGDELQTPTGWFSREGPVWTCARIAAHPAEATKARVSCNMSGDNGTTPRQVPEPPPVIDPALRAFLDGYRSALADGTARQVGTGVIDGQPVVWLELQDLSGANERVAIDRTTHRPILVRSQRFEYRIDSIESTTEQEADFRKPQGLSGRDHPTMSRTTDTKAVDPAAAAQDLSWPALWPGPAVQGLGFTSGELQTLRTGYTRESGLQPTLSTGLELRYGEYSTGSGRWIVIDEAPRPEFAYRWLSPSDGRAPEPPSGTLALTTVVVESAPEGGQAHPSGLDYDGQLVQNGVYVTLHASSRELLIRAARDLTPIAGHG